MANNSNEININIATNELTRVICEAFGALTDEDWREALELAIGQAERIRIDHNNRLYHVTVSPEAKARLIFEQGLSEAYFQVIDEDGE